jgi:dolichol-phosphate mannosyltransferase
MTPHLSIVMPVYNEERVIESVVGDLKRELCAELPDSELVLVNDASTDATGEILERLAAEDERVRVFHQERNGGHGPTLRRALDESRGTWIFQIDSDGQMVPAEFWRLWEQRRKADLIMGMRRIHRNGRHRIIVSAAARYVNRGLGGGNIRDVNVPFKLIHRRVWEDLKDDISLRPVAPSLLIAVGAGLRWRIAQVGITSLPRQHGPSSVDLKALVRLSWGAFAELIRYRARLARRGLATRRPRLSSVTRAP